MNHFLSWVSITALVCSPEAHVLFHPYVFHPRLSCQCWPTARGLLGGFLFFFSTLHFVVYLSHYGPKLRGQALQVSRSIDSLRACQHVRVHAGVAGVDSETEAWRGNTWKGSRVAWMAVDDGLEKNKNKTLFTLCSAGSRRRKKGSLVEVKRSPLDWLSCDIFVFQPSTQPQCSSSHFHQQSYISFITYLFRFFLEGYAGACY